MLLYTSVSWVKRPAFISKKAMPSGFICVVRVGGIYSGEL